jgi:hypothetical protein
MIDEYDKNYFLLSCDICGNTESGPFEDFYEAVQYKKDHKVEWHSLRLYDDRAGKYIWQDVCEKCFPNTLLGKWKSIPESKRPKTVDPGIGKGFHKKIKTVDSIADNIRETIKKREAEAKEDKDNIYDT